MVLAKMTYNLKLQEYKLQMLINSKEFNEDLADDIISVMNEMSVTELSLKKMNEMLVDYAK